ncbi:hypothetical protein CYY_002257 [Polysphondylium violaceum]|uniref:C2H2-type domain-containing protein n=1 Tax=Polysphondylium violaceum TaxID=133409 RepID=A0A8J4V9T5_9MYCE|nr:hypothetical protein CYY_002257 [Polysphondylium violaceum]
MTSPSHVNRSNKYDFTLALSKDPSSSIPSQQQGIPLQRVSHVYHTDHAFFNDGNSDRKNTLLKQKCIYDTPPQPSPSSVNQAVTTSSSSNMDSGSNSDNSRENNTEKKIFMSCECGKGFYSMLEYENHYYSIHKNHCTICKNKSFPNNKLLECHLLETHDTRMFDLLSLKRKMFECLVEGCERRFWTDHTRRLHLIDYHKYPNTFTFHTKKRLKEMYDFRQENTKEKEKDIDQITMDLDDTI